MVNINVNRKLIILILLFSGQCTVEINDGEPTHSYLTEGEIVVLKDKWFKVENCRLNRAYMAPCGSRLFHQMVDFVCAFTGQHSEQKIYKRDLSHEDLISIIDKTYFDLCCRSACTVAELLQYCPVDE